MKGKIMTRKQLFTAGMRDGMPICFGYFAVSFAFGIQAAGIGLSIAESAVLSAANVTSAGQFAALGIIAAGASYIELAFTQLIINLRYFHGLTQQRVAKILAVSQVQVSRIEKKALLHLKELLSA